MRDLHDLGLWHLVSSL